MRDRKTLIALGLVITGMVAACSNDAPTPINQSQPFPSGFDFPAEAAQLDQAVAARDEAAIRRHGWFLWAGLNVPAPNGLPIWRTWPTSTQAFALDAVSQLSTAPQSRHAARKLHNPIDLPAPQYPIPEPVKATYGVKDLVDGPVFQFNGDIMIVNVTYNPDAFNDIRSNRLFQASTLNQLKTQGLQEIPPFPSTSIVLKHMYWPVKGNGLTALPVWDPVPQTEPPIYYGYERWTKMVAVDPSGQPIPPGTEAAVTYLHGVVEHDKVTPLGPITKNAKVVPISKFFSQQFTQTDLDALSPADRAILDAAAYWNYGRLFQPGDFLISIAMHINTKELPYWTLQSLWWHDQPDEGPYAKDRPDIQPEKALGPWQHYLMVSEYGITEKPGGDTLFIAFNPYIELAAAHPIATNCRNCHIRAAWPRAGLGTPSASYLAKDGPGELAVLTPQSPIFKDLMLLDFQWAIADQAG